MKSSTIMYALLWKEWRTVMPLALGVAGLAVILYAVTLAIPGDRDSALFAYMLLLPNLVAFGVSALQVGHEDETGTLQWQRSLPVGPMTVLTSKFIIAILASALLWLTCAAGYVIAVKTGNIQRLPPDLVHTGSTPAVEIFRLVTFTIMLLACSLFSNWLLRSPAAGLLLSAVLAIFAAFAAIYLGESTDARSNAASSYSSSTSAWIAGYQILATVLLLLGALLLVRRRWARTSVFANDWSGRADAHPAYFPVKPIPQSTPSMTRALIWQAVRQARGIYAAIAAILFFAIIQHLVFETETPTHSENGWVLIATMISAGLLGIATFSGDSVKQRARFLSEHGVSRWKIWSSRMIVPVFFLLIIATGLLAWEISFRRIREPILVLPVFMAGLFAMGCLSAMWARRPIVGYLGAPLLLFVAVAAFSTIWQLYYEYFWTSLLGIMVIIACTFRMTRLWSDGERGWTYHGKFVGWYGLAGLAVIVPIFSHRLITMPRLERDWRIQTHAAASEISANVDLQQNERLEFIPVQLMYVDRNVYRLTDDSLTRIAKAIEDIKAGKNLLLEPREGARAFHRLLVTPSTSSGRAILSDMLVETDGLFALLFSGIDELSGKPLSLWMSDYLDRLEFVAAQALLMEQNQNELGEERVADYASRLRTPAQRRQDRNNALLLSWALHNSEGWSPYTAYAGLIGPDSIGDLLEQIDERMSDRAYSFGGYGMNVKQTRVDTLSFERVRLFRYLDRATRISLEQAQDVIWPQSFDYVGGRFTPATMDEVERVHAWSQASLPAGHYVTSNDVSTRDLTYATTTGLWNDEVEQTIERARKLSGN